MHVLACCCRVFFSSVGGLYLDCEAPKSETAGVYTDDYICPVTADPHTAQERDQPAACGQENR